MLPIAQLPTSSPSGGLPPLSEGPSLDRLRPPPGAESGPETWQILVVLLGLLAIFACLLLLYRNRTRKTPAPLAPDQAALAEIEAARQHASNDIDLTMLCSGAVRRLLFHQYNLPHHGLTHEELAEKLPLEKAEKEQIRNFFSRCDGVKFAGIGLSEEGRHEVLDTATQLVQAHRGKEVRQT